MKINWVVRMKNRAFWIALIPAVLLLAQNVAAMGGIGLDISVVSDQLLAVVNSVFAVLAVLGIVTDPTTKGIGDSEKALTYEEPF